FCILGLLALISYVIYSFLTAFTTALAHTLEHGLVRAWHHFVLAKPLIQFLGAVVCIKHFSGIPSGASAKILDPHALKAQSWQSETQYPAMRS
ncbi:hypothetical protein, partial [Vibrio sp. 1074]|uniref:hypothetical protein n=1 Tax=Vibrio sp. 1074 TaxID=3074542 RepID=UPI002963F5AD